MITRLKVRHGAGLVLVCALVAGCRVGVDTGVAVERGGSGSITVVVTADDATRDALARGGLGTFGESLFGSSPQRALPAGSGGGDAFADLRDAGWQVDAVAGGVRVRRDFAAGEDLGPALAALGGGDVDLSPVQALSVSAGGGFPKDEVTVSGRVGLSEDAIVELATRSGAGAGANPPTRAEIEDVLGQAVTSLVSVRFHLDLPGSIGDVDADPAPLSADDLTWDLPGGRVLDFTAASSYWNSAVVWTFVVVAVLVVAAAAFVVWRRLVVRRRRRARSVSPRRPRAPATRPRG